MHVRFARKKDSIVCPTAFFRRGMTINDQSLARIRIPRLEGPPAAPPRRKAKSAAGQCVDRKKPYSNSRKPVGLCRPRAQHGRRPDGNVPDAATRGQNRPKGTTKTPCAATRCTNFEAFETKTGSSPAKRRDRPPPLKSPAGYKAPSRTSAAGARADRSEGAAAGRTPWSRAAPSNRASNAESADCWDCRSWQR